MSSTASTASARPAGRQYSTFRIVLTVFLPFAGGYFLSYLFRSVNAIIAPDLTRELGLSPADLGLLTSAYFLSFACMQLPLGIAMDRFGPRRVQACFLLSAALGALVFGLGQDKLTLLAGRALIGIGVAGGLMTSFKAIVLWFPASRWPLVNGCFMAMGGLGALSATQPVEWALGLTDWRGIFFVLAAITLAVALTIFLVVPEKPASGRPVPLREQIASLRMIYRDPLFWCIAPCGIFSMASTMAIQGLWAGPWLADVAALPRADVARHLLVLTAAMTAGFVLTGALADFLARRGFGIYRTMSLGVVLILSVQLLLVLQVAPGAYWVWALFGLTANVTVLCYPILSRHFPTEYAGRANSALNLPVFAAAFALQYAIGGIIGLWPTTAGGGQPPIAYAAAFALPLALQFASFLWMIWRGRNLESLAPSR
ncbi:MAG: MFS transporter [Alphaproteobacteria bacterium]|nr:MFS transporter [Alphaproteobacteria bacterium]